MLVITNFLSYEKPPVGDFSGEIIRYSGNFVKVYFAERCACYPYIFPTIFPRAAAGRSLHSRLMTTMLFSPDMVFLLKSVDLVRVYRIARQLSILQPNYHRARDVMQQLMEVQHTEECDHRLDRRCGEWLLKSGAEGVARLIMVKVSCVKCC